MMKFNHNYLTTKLKNGLESLKQYGFISLGEDGIAIKAEQGNQITVQKTADEILITYDTESHFYMAFARAIGMKEGVQTIEAKVKDLGVMLDCSRNAVMKPEEVKRLICFLSLAGYNYLELYTEETYELPDEPYFGYMRGRYTRKELEEIVAFADSMGFRMVPCVQALAHLKNLTNWLVYAEHMDIDDILLVNDERTYALIRKCLRYCKEVFHEKRINIGTDEAFHLGRGKYTDKYGYESKHDIYLKHLKKVFEICKEEGVEPEFWADAFYETECPKEEVQAIFDGTQVPVYWDYYSTDKQYHLKRMNTLKEYAGQVMYGGGVWKWIGYAPDNDFSNKVTDVAFEAAEECAVDNILMTAWGDNGDECSIYAVIPSMWYAACKLYPCESDGEKIMESLTGYTIAEWLTCDLPNRVDPEYDHMSNFVRYSLYNDYIIGLLDEHVPDYAGDYYAGLCEKFSVLAKRDSQFNYLFQSYEQLCHVLIRKATFGKRIYAAYQKDDREALANLVEELSLMKEDIRAFHDVFRTLWMKENKGYGFEVMDMRIGGMISRADTVITMVNEYLAGKSDKIYELEAERLPYWCGAATVSEQDRYSVLHNCWATAYTVNHL